MFVENFSNKKFFESKWKYTIKILGYAKKNFREISIGFGVIFPKFYIRDCP